jgi:hypothetical protein
VRNFSLIVIGLLLGICWGLIGCSASAGDYTIEKVVEIGPADWVPTYMPLKWSPDGTKLAYFHDRFLYISDTLGNSRQVKGIDIPLHQYEWLSNTEIILSPSSRDSRSAGQMIVINTDSASEESIEEYIRKRFPESTCKVRDFDGPTRTVEGNVYFRVVTDDNRSIRFVEDPKKFGAKSLSAADNHFVRWGTDALYMVNCDRSDSMRIARKPYENMPLNPEISPDGAYIMIGGTMQRLADSTYIILDTMIKTYPPKTRVCGFVFQTFNPSAHEVLFQLSCDDGHFYVTNAIGTYDYDSHKFTIIDQLINRDKCTAPSYAPDGRRIAFLSYHRAFILTRGSQ